MENKVIIYIFAVVLFTGTAIGYSFTTTIDNILYNLYCQSCTIDDAKLAGNQQYISELPYFYSAHLNSWFRLVDDNSSSIYFAFESHSPTPYSNETVVQSAPDFISIGRYTYSYDDWEQYIRLESAGISIKDIQKSNGYACWSGGFLVSQATPCV